MKKFEYMFMSPKKALEIVQELKKYNKISGTLEVYNFLGRQGWIYQGELASNALFMRELETQTGIPVSSDFGA
jgi:hypothetical protein